MSGQSNIAFIKNVLCCRKNGIVIFCFRGKFFSVKNKKGAKRPNKFLKANQLEMMPNGQIRFFRPTNLKRGQITDIWPEKANLATLTCPADNGAGTSDLQSRHSITPEQWTWLLCNVSVVLANKLSLQEINQLIGIELATSSILENFGSCNFQGGKNAHGFDVPRVQNCLLCSV